MNQDMPKILIESHYTTKDLAELKKLPIWETRDIYESQLAELFEIEHPALRMSPDFKDKQAVFIKETTGTEPELKGNWVYLPWSGVLIHMVIADAYYRLRTNRNQLIISSDEQAKLKDFRVGVTGLSVGNGIAVSLVYSGVGALKLAEFDTLETANLNRLRSGIHFIGKPKLAVTTQQIYEIDPFAEIATWPEGLKETNLNEFISGEQPLDVVFDEIDDFEMKIRLRIAAKKAKVPVIMLTSLGDNILVDVERYDSDPDLQIFNGLLGDLPQEILTTKIGEKEKIKYAMQTVGVEYVPTRALQTLLHINRTLVGRPQLYSTIAVDGGLASYLVRRLALGQDLPSGRQYISFDKIMGLAQTGDDGRSEILQQLRDMTK